MADKKVAVIVVHGVANQEPSESARQIANLLTDLCPLGTYSTFQEEKIRVPVEPVTVPPAAPLRRSPFEERNHDVLLRHRGNPPAGVDPDQGFMRDQLRGYTAAGPRVFETVRLDGTRNESGCRVHVYEAYWADLSRLGKGILVFFGALYQLLLHLPSLGRNAVDYARAENGNGRLWPLFSWLHRWSVRWLTLFIVVLNLVIASLVLPALAPRLTRGGGGASSITVVDVVTHVVMALVFIAVAAWLLKGRRSPAWLWTLAPLAAAAAGWFLADAICRTWGAGRFLVFEAWAFAAILIAAALKGYNNMRRGSLLVGAISLAACGAALFVLLSDVDGTEDSLTEAVLRTLQLVAVTLQLVWRIHVPWLLITIVIGFLCWATTVGPWKHRAWNTIWTARATLTLSTALFANLTLAVWAAVFKGVQRVLPAGRDFRPLHIWEPIAKFLCVDVAPVKPVDYLQNTLMLSASRAFIFITLVFAAFALAAIWSIFPSVLVETKPPKTQAADTRRMRSLGVWLTRGLNFIPAAAEIFTVLLIAIVVYVWWQTGPPCKQPDVSSWKAISAAGALLASLIAARFWLPGADAALDILLDVDNYLRQHPKDDTPRARIAERCASLLRFILDPNRCGHDYSEVVIIAHSQGTIITADLLRFLKREGSPVMARLEKGNLAFFTMGCPLRQLYARAFPALYPWMWMPGGPQREELGASEWVNAYCSGDYVGRFVWNGVHAPGIWDRRSANPQNAGTPTVTNVAPGVEQMCIGEGAHTHYWDRYGADIAWKLDTLIGARC